jgi:hypothetical protein
MFEFVLHSISGTGLLIGWCGNRDIPVGTNFTTVRRDRFYRDGSGTPAPESEVVGVINLQLCEVHWYQRTIERVPRGHSAALAVSGEGMELLAQLLGNLQPDEVLSLEASGG